MRLSRMYLWLIAACVLIGAFLLINAEIATIVYLPDTPVLVGLCGMALAYAMVGLGCAAVYERGQARGLMSSGMVIGLVALLAWTAMIFSRALQEDALAARLFTWLTVWPCLMMLVGLVLLLPMHNGWRWRLRASTIVLLVLVALFIACAVTFYPEPTGAWDDDEWRRARRYENAAARIGWSLAPLTLGSLTTTLIIGIAGALTGRAPATSPERKPYWLQCPRCGLEQDALTGDHYCTSCKLRTRVDLA